MPHWHGSPSFQRSHDAAALPSLPIYSLQAPRLLPSKQPVRCADSQDQALASNASTRDFPGDILTQSKPETPVCLHNTLSDSTQLPDDLKGPSMLKMPATVSGSKAPLMRGQSLKLASLHKRIFHHDDPHLPAFATLELSKNTDYVLPPFPSPTSPTKPRRINFRINESKSLWLSLYFCFNLCLTLYNKGVLVRFPFPYTLTAVHALCGSIGSALLVRAGVFSPTKLSAREIAILAAFSVLYTVNIVVSNSSLHLVTVPFHQVVRAATPLFTIFFSVSILGIQSSRTICISLIPVIAGVGLATYGDYYFTRWGFVLTLIGTALAALKTIFTNVLQSPSSTHNIPKLSPLHLLYFLSPLAFIQTVALAQLSGELDRIRQHSPSWTQLCLLLLNGTIAFGLNVVSFNANRKVGALGMTVAANVKQVLTVLCAVLLFDLTITTVNASGILLTLLGGAVYAWVEYREKRGMKFGL
ncbi:triose-phosphate transporter family-domain-containing protein [Infundibulicybe gibba]|nr:triose-phosphate transporter family-domain-containing protein [Infundibulicybe gibba]